MKMYGKLFVLCLFLPNFWASTAFVAQVPKTLTSTRGKNTPAYMSTSGGGSDASNSVDESRMKALEKALEARLNALEEKQTPDAPKPASTPSSSGAKSEATNPSQLWDTTTPMTVQGGSLRTWSFSNPNVKSVQVFLKTEGRPLDADIELWQGPDNTPHKLKVYVEDGGLRTFNAVIGTPRGPNTIAIRNIGHLEFPLSASLLPDDQANIFDTVSESSHTIQGGALRTYPFGVTTESVSVMLKTDGRPLNARIELLQGPNNNKQVIEVYTEDGMDRPFFAVIETPGSGNVVRIVNTAPVEFPMTASVEPYVVASSDSWTNNDVIIT